LFYATLFSLQLKAKIQYMYRQFAHVTLPIVTKRPETIVPIKTDNTTAVNSSLRFLSTQMEVRRIILFLVKWIIQVAIIKNILNFVDMAAGRAK